QDHPVHAPRSLAVRVQSFAEAEIEPYQVRLLGIVCKGGYFFVVAPSQLQRDELFGQGGPGLSPVRALEETMERGSDCKAVDAAGRQGNTGNLVVCPQGVFQGDLLPGEARV